ncbi:MAG TPA: peptidase P60 [Gammaproteobacteria bacterium]|nr:peptidase P60 [Gammaproteobacteria bacterium]
MSTGSAGWWEIITEARRWLGTPFHHQGRCRGVGVDCAGVVIGVARTLGLSGNDVAGYGREPYRGLLMRELDSQMQRIDAPEPGAVLLLRFAVEPQHLAICTDQETLIHAYQTAGACVEHRYSDLWRARTLQAYVYHGARRWPS